MSIVSTLLSYINPWTLVRWVVQLAMKDMNMSVVDSNAAPAVDPSAAPVEPAPADAPAPAAPVEAPAAAPRGLAAIVADVEEAVAKLKDFATRRSLLDAAEADAKSVLAALKTEWEAEKAKLEAFF